MLKDSDNTVRLNVPANLKRSLVGISIQVI